jgi:hypothetical protein
MRAEVQKVPSRRVDPDRVMGAGSALAPLIVLLRALLP